MDQNLQLLNLIYETAKDTAPVTVQIGRVVNHVCRPSEIILKEAPPKIINVLVEHGYVCDLTPDGMHVFKF